MTSIIRAACVAALAFLIVPQTAFGLVKPSVADHADSAPSESWRAADGSGYLPAGSLGGGGSYGSNAMTFSSLTDGDMVVVLDGYSTTGHAGVFDRTRYDGLLSNALISANVTPVNGVQYEKCAKYRMYDKAYALRVSMSSANRTSVRSWAARQLGKPYALISSKTDYRSFYCSKLAWGAYRSVTGLDIDGDGGVWVWPVDLITSRYTDLVGSWS